MRGQSIEEIALRLSCPPALVWRAACRLGLPRRPGQVYRLADIAEGLALLALDGENATRRDALRKVCESVAAMFAGIAKLAECLAFRITTTPSRREGAQTGTQKRP